MFKNTAKWNVYKVAFDKREGIHNLISHLKESFIDILQMKKLAIISSAYDESPKVSRYC